MELAITSHHGGSGVIKSKALLGFLSIQFFSSTTPEKRKGAVWFDHVRRTGWLPQLKATRAIELRKIIAKTTAVEHALHVKEPIPTIVPDTF